jgi:hypothetical protein
VSCGILEQAVPVVCLENVTTNVFAVLLQPNFQRRSACVHIPFDAPPPDFVNTLSFVCISLFLPRDLAFLSFLQLSFPEQNDEVVV